MHARACAASVPIHLIALRPLLVGVAGQHGTQRQHHLRDRQRRRPACVRNHHCPNLFDPTELVRVIELCSAGSLLAFW